MDTAERATRHFAVLLDGREQWRPLTQLHPTKLITAKAGQHKDFDEDKHIVGVCMVSSKAVRTTNDFYRWVNDKQDCGTSTAYHDSKLPWAGARHMGLVDDNVVAYEYVFPKLLQDEVVSSLRAKEAASVLIDGDAEGVYILTQAQYLNPIRTQLELETEILCALDMEVPVLGTRQVDSPFCLELLAQETPLCKYSKLVDLMELSGKLWQGGRIMIKTLSTDQRVRFGMWAYWRPPKGVEELELLEPGEVSQYTVRRLATMFGAITKLEHHHRYNHKGLTRYKIVYKHMESSVICDGMEFETVAGTLEFKGVVDEDVLEQLKTKHDYDMADEDEEGWRLIAAKEYEAAAAQEEARGWLSAQALQKLQDETNE